MKKVLIIYNYILHYRTPFFNELAKHYEVTVLHSGTKATTEIDEYSEIITEVKKVGPFYIQKGVIQEASSDKYDVVIYLFDVRWLATLWSFICTKKNKTLILWGAWITQSEIANKVRLYFTKRDSANVFYTQEARADFMKFNLPYDRLYVANNTFDVGNRIESYKNDKKHRILFVGSLDARKELDVLIKAFCSIEAQIPDDIVLTIIGGGHEKSHLQKLAKTMECHSKIEFLGVINNIDTLKDFYKEAIVSVSFGQAGLTVLQSLGYGVPFITKINAISGGEKTNIKHGLNGLFCEDNQQSLENNLIRLCNDIKYSRSLGKNAFEYYTEYCTVKNMVQGFQDAIEKTKLAKIDLD